MLTGVSLDAKLSSIFKKIGDRQLTKEVGSGRISMILRLTARINWT